MNGKTLGRRMGECGITHGFDYLTLGLALAVLAWHSIFVSGDENAAVLALGPMFGPLKAAVLPMFFTLSGFLVAGSLARSRTLAGFASLRVIRLVPALTVEVLLSALVLGPLVTSVPLSVYFSNAQFWLYLLNALGEIHYHLPGVFLENPRPGIVNLSPWTVPYELGCYVSLMVLAVLGLHRHPGLFASLVVASVGILSALYWLGVGSLTTSRTLPGTALILAFLAGWAVYLWRDRIRLSSTLALCCALAGFICLSFSATLVLAVLPLSYLTIWLGLLHPPKVPVIMGGDYSYGIYLFAYPIQQTLAMFEPIRGVLANFLGTLVLSFLYAAFSWHLIEKPILARKKDVVSLVERWVEHIRLKAWGQRKATR